MQDFLNQLQGLGEPAKLVTLDAALFSLVFATLLGSLLAFVYSVTYTGKKEDRTQIIFTIILLCMGGALVWLLVADNLVRAFGLAGALSLIRYRTNVNDPKDTSLVFFSMLFGMACGVHQYHTALIGVALLSLVLAVMKWVSGHVRRSVTMMNGNGPKSEGPEPEGEDPAGPLLDRRAEDDD